MGFPVEDTITCCGFFPIDCWAVLLASSWTFFTASKTPGLGGPVPGFPPCGFMFCTGFIEALGICCWGCCCCCCGCCCCTGMGFGGAESLLAPELPMFMRAFMAAIRLLIIAASWSLCWSCWCLSFCLIFWQNCTGHLASEQTLAW